jgi:hypothetical protein
MVVSVIIFTGLRPAPKTLLGVLTRLIELSARWW